MLRANVVIAGIARGSMVPRLASRPNFAVIAVMLIVSAAVMIAGFRTLVVSLAMLVCNSPKEPVSNSVAEILFNIFT